MAVHADRINRSWAADESPEMIRPVLKIIECVEAAEAALDKLNARTEQAHQALVAGGTLAKVLRRLAEAKDISYPSGPVSRDLRYLEDVKLYVSCGERRAGLRQLLIQLLIEVSGEPQRGQGAQQAAEEEPDQDRYDALLTRVNYEANRILGYVAAWNRRSPLHRRFTFHKPPRQLPSHLLSDIRRLMRWSKDLHGLSADDIYNLQRLSHDDLDDYQRKAEYQIRQRMHSKVASAVAHLKLPEPPEDANKALEALVAVRGLATREWLDPLWQTPALSHSSGGDVRIGRFCVDAPNAAGPLEPPATLHFPFDRAIFIDGAGATRSAAIEIARSICARLLATVPAGKAQFTFIDHDSQGDSIADFMHLADFNKELVGVKPATESRDIEERLGALSAHVEMVISAYLRRQFNSIDEYNQVAGELAEPYHVLVVFDYPAGFSEQAGQQLLRLVENGPRCGVHTIVITDSTQKQLRDISLDHLLRNRNRVTWTRGETGLLAELDLADPSGRIKRSMIPDSSPSIIFDTNGTPRSAVATLLVAAGEQSQSIGKAPVTLARMLPVLNHVSATGRSAGLPRMLPPVSIDFTETSTWWRGSTAANAIAPLGLAGVRDIAAMFFSSEDIASGAIMVGLPGAGKSTSLHAAILTMCMMYGPDELELYLIDAKHGVEFKDYERLPHAQMVSIHSEREFSLAILKSLDDEIAERAALMNRSTEGRAKNITSYRAETGDRMTRILLIMDEFHEIFEEDDRIGHEAFSHFSNILRFGRFAGVHVVVASQTLSSPMPALDKGTLQLLPQRVAFMCTEADAITVMGDANRGTKILTAVGKGLFNSKRGEVSHNKPFQGLFITADQRGKVNREMIAKGAAAAWRREPRVFDGESTVPRPTSLSREASTTQIRIPVGEPFTGDPRKQVASVNLSRRRQSNVLVLGDVQDESVPDMAARSALHSCILGSLAVSAQVRVIDYVGDESVSDDLTIMEIARLADIQEYVRHRGAAKILHELAMLIEERLSAHDYSSPSQVLILFGLQRALDLQPVRSSVLSDATAAGESVALGRILRDGPEVGVHVIADCDSIRSIERRLDRTLLDEFAFRLAASTAVPGDLPFVCGTNVRPPQVRRNQLLIGDHFTGKAFKVRSYPPVTAADISLFKDGYK